MVSPLTPSVNPYSTDDKKPVWTPIPFIPGIRPVQLKNEGCLDVSFGIKFVVPWDKINGRQDGYIIQEVVRLTGIRDCDTDEDVTGPFDMEAYHRYWEAFPLFNIGLNRKTDGPDDNFSLPWGPPRNIRLALSHWLCQRGRWLGEAAVLCSSSGRWRKWGYFHITDTAEWMGVLGSGHAQLVHLVELLLRPSKGSMCSEWPRVS